MKLLTNQEFITRAKNVHGNTYDYGKSVYTRAADKVTITCPHHGDFEQKANNHLNGKGCAMCDVSMKKTTNDFIIDARKAHGDKYDYSNVQYVNSKTPVDIICPVHGAFRQIRITHLNGHGCPRCYGNNKKTHQEFIQEAIIKHGNKYDYSLAKYNGKNKKITIICPEHGEFEQRGGNHLRGDGCAKCGDVRMVSIRTHTIEQFIEHANLVHDNKYLYTNAVYTRSQQKLIITCPDHGDFAQDPSNHLAGKGCPKCSHRVSKAELEIRDFLSNTITDTLIFNDRNLIAPVELDIYIPSHNIAIEYCGIYWHSELFRDKNYHKNKYDKCAEQNIQLITIFEDEWMTNKDIVKSKIMHLLGKNVDAVYARKCIIGEIDKTSKKTFLDCYHIQGNCNSTLDYGLYHDNELVACMSFLSTKKGHILTRYATAKNVTGGFSKLLTYFKRNNEWDLLISFSDSRWSNGDLYTKNGWIYDGMIYPDYSYVVGQTRKHKFGYRKKLLSNKLDNYDASISEHENCMNNKIYRIYDCGKRRFIMRPE